MENKVSKEWLQILTDQRTLNQIQPVGKKRARTQSQKIYFSEFEQASQYTTDPEWKEILLNCSKKKFPTGFKYDNFRLKHTQSNSVLVLPEDDLETLAEASIKFFQELGKVYSRLDRAEMERVYRENNQVTRAPIVWSSISKSPAKRLSAIKEYVNTNYSKLSPEIRSELLTTINSLLALKQITKEQIIFEDNRIVQIVGITADRNGVKITKPSKTKTGDDFLTKRVEGIRKESNPKKYQYQANWEDYKKKYRNYISKKGTGPSVTFASSRKTYT